MFIERPPLFYRMLFPETIWRLPCKEKTIYLTFDDGPVPEITPWVLNLLDYYNVKATFFCVGENVARNTELYAEILKRGHHTGNHTMNHIQGTKYSVKDYIRNVDAANELIHSALFRPPHGHMCFGQAHELRQKYKIIMWDVVTRDYSKKLNGERVFNNVKIYPQRFYHRLPRLVERRKKSAPCTTQVDRMAQRTRIRLQTFIKNKKPYYKIGLSYWNRYCFYSPNDADISSMRCMGRIAFSAIVLSTVISGVSSRRQFLNFSSVFNRM